MQRDRALLLVEKCLPQLLVRDGDNHASKVPPPTTGLESKDSVKLRKMCRLWAGMGYIYQVDLWNGRYKFVIKHVAVPPSRNRQSFGDRRKAGSYLVEANFYGNLAAPLIQNHGIQLPLPYLVEHGPASGEITICMSLLEGTSIDMSKPDDVKSALSWLAKFHSVYWGQDGVDEVVQQMGLQQLGSYWHLDTRPEEHENMSKQGWEGRLRRAAKAIDSCLKRDPMQCLIHGDPKKDNMMVLDTPNANGSDGKRTVAMYDLQYCGKGTPTRDIAYFLCSSCDEDKEHELVEYYYNQLVDNLSRSKATNDVPTLEHLKDSLELAFCDFCRFMCGWGHWGYDVQSRVQIFLSRLDGGKDLGSEEAYDKAIRKILW